MISRRNLEEWISTTIRVVGILGLGYEVLVDHLKTPTALVVFGGLAGLPDVLGYRQSVREQVEKEEEEKQRGEHQ